MDEVLQKDRQLGPEDAAKLDQLVRREFSVTTDPGVRFSETPEPNEVDLIPYVLKTKGGGTVNRFLTLEVADPVRTEVLCFLATRDVLLWIDQHYPPSQMEVMESSGAYGRAGRADVIRHWQSKTTAERELACLLNRHPDDSKRIAQLAESISGDEIQAFRTALGLLLHEYPNRS